MSSWTRGGINQSLSSRTSPRNSFQGKQVRWQVPYPKAPPASLGAYCLLNSLVAPRHGTINKWGSLGEESRCPNGAICLLRLVFETVYVSCRVSVLYSRDLFEMEEKISAAEQLPSWGSSDDRVAGCRLSLCPPHRRPWEGCHRPHHPENYVWLGAL